MGIYFCSVAWNLISKHFGYKYELFINLVQYMDYPTNNKKIECIIEKK